MYGKSGRRDRRVFVMRGRRALRGGALWLWMGVLVFAGLPERGAWAVDAAPVREARLSFFQGDVTVQRADNTGNDPAQLNMELVEGTRVVTGQDGQAEIEFEDGSLLRVTPQSTVVLSRLGTGADGSLETQVGVLNGLVYAELRASAKVGYRIEAGGSVVTPLANATIRILLDQPPAEIAVLDGTSQVDQAGGRAVAGYPVQVEKGESLRGDASGGGRYFLAPTIEHNSWDDWNEEREQVAADDLAARTAARDGFAGNQGYGWSDLDANGTWYDAGQGPVWQPFDASVSGFDPYGYGSWVWSGGTGYVWNSAYSWGWTPFRCGSWNYWQDFGWGWAPSAGCGYGGGLAYGGFGPGRGRRGNRINLSNVPAGYRRPMPPVAGGPVRVHPIIPVRTGPGPTGERVRPFEARQIAGQTAMPLRTQGSGYTPRGGSAVGSTLRRDFPVDQVTGRPVLGLATAPGAGRRGPDGAVRAGAAPGGTGLRGAEGLTNGRAGVQGDGTRPVYPARRTPVAGTAATPATVAPVDGGRGTAERRGGQVNPVYRMPPPPVVHQAPVQTAAPIRSAPPVAVRPAAPAAAPTTATPKK